MNGTKRTKLLVAIGLLVVIGGLVAVAIVRRGDEAVAVRAALAERRDLVESVQASGWVRPRRAVDIQSDIIGRITELAVEEGEQVQRGQFLLRIDPTQYEAALTRARAAVSEALAREAQARANMIQAEQNRKRAGEMLAFDSSLVSPQDLEDAETALAVQRALHEAAVYGVQQARAAVREAEDRLSKSVIRAPMDGVVTRLNVEEGETAIVGTMNNPGSLLLTVSDLSVMEAVIQVDETDVPLIQIGDSAEVRIDAFSRQRFHGQVTEIGHSSTMPAESRLAQNQSQAVDFEVVITLYDPPPVLRPDLSATAEVVTNVRPDALAIPIIALTVRERDSLEALEQESPEARAAVASLGEADTDVEGVFVIRGGKAYFTPVVVGITGRERFEVLAGLAEGDSVVAGPYEAVRQLENEAAVRVMEEEDGPGRQAAS